MTDALHIAEGYSARPYGDGYIIHHESGGAWAADLAMVAAVREIERLRAAIAAPAVPPDVMRDAERYRWLRTSNSHHLHNSAWLASLTAVKDGPCDIFSADEVPALLDAEIDRRMAAAPTAQQGASHEQP